MKALSQIGLFSFLCILSGCRSMVPGERTLMTAPLEVQLSAECAAMSQIGDYQALISDLNESFEELFTLAEGDKLPSPGQVAKLQAEIGTDITELKSLARPEWNSEKWEIQLGWDLNSSLFAYLKSQGHVYTPQLSAIEVLGGVLFGEPMPKPIAGLEVRTDPASAHVGLRLKASTLELCYLERAIDLSVRVSFESPDGLGAKVFDLVIPKRKR